MENEKTEMGTVKEECKLCGAEGVRTTFKHPAGLVQVIFNCSNLECPQHKGRVIAERKESKKPEEHKLICPLCKAEIEHLCSYVNYPCVITPDRNAPDGCTIAEESGGHDTDFGSVYCPECGGNITEGDILEALKLCGYEVD